LFDREILDEDVTTIHASLQRQHALRPDRCQPHIEAMLDRRERAGRIGRPRKPTGSLDSDGAL
jgi:hypothetical protein